MGFLGNFFNKATISLTDWNAGTNLVKENVTVDTSTNIAMVWSCINLKSDQLAKLPFQIYQKTKDGRRRADDHYLAKLIERRPSPLYTPFIFKKTMIVHQNVYGHAIIKKNYIGSSTKVDSLEFLHPPDVTIEYANGKRWFKVKENEIEKTYSDDDIIYLPYILINGVAKSPLTVARENISVIMKQQKFLASYYTNSSLMRGILKTSQNLNSSARDKIRSEWQKANSGDSNMSKIAVLDGNFEFQNVTLPLADAEFVNSSKLQNEDICRIFGVMPHQVGILDRATFNNIEHLSLEFISSTLSPLATNIEEEYNYKIFSDKEIKEGYFVKFNMNAALKVDSKSRSEFFKVMSEIGVYSINDILKLEDREPIEHGDGHYKSLNYVDVKYMEEYQKAKATLEGGE